jgi:hypothetical protein
MPESPSRRFIGWRMERRRTLALLLARLGPSERDRREQAERPCLTGATGLFHSVASDGFGVRGGLDR